MKQSLKTYNRIMLTQLKSLLFGKPGANHKRTFTVTVDDTRITIRPAKCKDSVALYALHQRLSQSSLYYRYLQLHRPTLQEMERISSLRADQGFALVAEIVGSDPALVALAFFVQEDDRSLHAEPAIIVDDRFQGRGLGKIMFVYLCRLAGDRRIAVLHAYIHRDNQGMRKILERIGYPVQLYPGNEIIEADIILQPQLGLGWQSDHGDAFGFAR